MNQETHPINPVQWAQQQLSQYGRIGATRVIKVPQLAAPLSAVVGAVAQAPILTWRDPGTVIALYAQERTGTLAKFAGTEVSVQFTGDEFLVTNGTGSDFAPLLSLVGPNTNWFPITRRVRRGETWSVTYRQEDPAGTTSDPSVLFAFIADADLGRITRDMADERARRQAQR